MGRRTHAGWGIELTQPAIAGVVIAVFAHAAWTSTASRAAYLVEFGIAAALLVNMVWALVVVARTRVIVEANGCDAIVGDMPSLGIRVEGPRREVLVRMASSPGAPAVRASAPQAGPLPTIASFRGIAEAAVVEVLWRGPLGLAGFSRRRLLLLAQPLTIGPKPVATAGVVFPRDLLVGADAGGGPLGPGDVVRSVRGYTQGDPLRLVHWSATARTGDVVVKELELSVAPIVTIVADLNPGGAAADAAAGRAAWLCAHALRLGHRVVLVTVELDATIGAEVDAPLVASRRLARATAGAVELPPGAGEVLLVDADKATWIRR